MDIRPSNCIVRISSGLENVQVLLIDWGCAAKIGEEEITGFRGCFPFAHDKLLVKKLKPWWPEAEYDLASVAYTLASLSQDKPIPWNHFNTQIVPNESLDDRSTVAGNLLEAMGLEAVLLKKLLSYIKRGDVDRCESKRKRE
jgi:hypothetical protein